MNWRGTRRQVWSSIIILGTLLVFTRSLSALDITPAQRAEARRLQAEVSTTEKLMRQEKFSDASERAKATLQSLDELVASGDEDVARLVKSQYRRLKVLRTRLILEGFDIPSVMLPGESAETPPENATSFRDQVAPILVSKCGRCHVNRASGGVSLANFATILQGPNAGKIVFPGNAEGSRIIEVIVEGDMPRGGRSLSDEELATLKAWISEGARFDADDRNANLVSLVPDRSGNAPTRAEVVMSKGTESVSFATDIAPVLMENCNGCHITARNARGGLNLSDFRRLIRGGDTGALVIQGKPDESLLVKKLEGSGDGNRMPQGRPPLDQEVIAKIRTWIAEGATFDGGDASLPIRTVAAVAKAKNATHEELSAERLTIAERNWDLAMPNVDHQTVTIGDYVLVGNLDEATLKQIGERATDVAAIVARLFKARSRNPLIKGRMSLFVFRSRYDYSEFGQMVEQRQLPDDWKGHWKFTQIDAYGVILLPRSEQEYSLDAVLAEQIAGAHIASLGAEIPVWFAEGGARIAAIRVARDDPRASGWLEAQPAALARLKRPDAFLLGDVSREDRQLASMSFVEFLMSDARRFSRLLAETKKGEPFDDAFEKVYGGTPAQLTTLWAKTYSRGRRRR